MKKTPWNTLGRESRRRLLACAAPILVIASVSQ